MRSFLLALGIFVVSAVASAACDPSSLNGGTCSTQAVAYSTCLSAATYGGRQGFHCIFYSPQAGAIAGCGSGTKCSTDVYGISNNGAASGMAVSWNWFVASGCPAGTSPDGQSDYSFNDPGGTIGGGATVISSGSCCETIDTTDPNYASAWSASDKSDATATGHFVATGGYCADMTKKLPLPPVLKPFEYCKPGVTGCYNTFKDAFCAQTASGEWNCIPRTPTNDQGGCISGATGSECYSKSGNPVPPPPDPPIQKGTPPDGTNNYTINNGGTTNNYTTNNYSGTSAGPQSSSPPSSSPGGSGSNTSGNGNTGKNGTDSNGNCPNGSKPTASGCSGTYTDNGCDIPPACFGDAVLCGIAANTHKSACAASGSSIGSPPAGLDGDPTDNSGDPMSSAVSSSVDLGDATGSLDGSGFGYSSACPLQDVSFSVFGQSVDIPFADKCDKLAFLKYIVLALAYFMAAKIIAGVQ